MDQLFNKYNVNVPRYTSYPTIMSWNNEKCSSEWTTHVNRQDEIDLYFHIPFCSELCWYCGCNRKITRDSSQIDLYTEYLLKEWKLLEAKSSKVKSVHFGGGTPNALSIENFKSLYQNIIPENAELSIELDPRTLEEGLLTYLSSKNLKHTSFGIQDFDVDVQNAINRYQPYDLVEKVVSDLRSQSDCSINFDLIYGLPKQSIDSIHDTIVKVKKLNPDYIALYSYAHLPRMFPAQKLIKDADLKNGKSKRELYEYAKNELESVGYVEIGLDHFALKDSKLHKASLRRSLKRSFMGYTEKKTQTLVGIGASSISEGTDFYLQNAKSIKEYFEFLDSGKLPFVKTHIMSSEDKESKRIINELMCNLYIDKKDVEDGTCLNEYLDDKLLEEHDDTYLISSIGRPFLRNIASTFDQYLVSETSFSKSL
mgnify:FL=1